jgi:hypothetical protein
MLMKCIIFRVVARCSSVQEGHRCVGKMYFRQERTIVCFLLVWHICCWRWRQYFSSKCTWTCGTIRCHQKLLFVKAVWKSCNQYVNVTECRSRKDMIPASYAEVPALNVRPESLHWSRHWGVSCFSAFNPGRNLI